ncbi:MAG TPA: ABC transporter permease subunit/CPBP intramembrane protease [Planctomycetota bacterium]|jgi:sodium transport system permease protein
MLPPKVRAVFIKELRDSLRDRRTVMATVFIPLLLWPVMLLLMTEATQMARTRLQHETHMVAVPVGKAAFFNEMAKLAPDEVKTDEQNGGLDPEMKASFSREQIAAPKTTLYFREMSIPEAEKALEIGAVRAFVVLPDDFQQKLAAQKQTSIEIKYDQAEERSRDAQTRLHALFERYRREVVDKRLVAKSLTHDVLQPFNISSLNVAHAKKVGGSIIGAFLPMMFIMMIIAGSIHPAVDMTAGEKERSTLETLVGSPVRSIEIIAGKFLAVATLSLGNAGVNVASFAATFMMLPIAKAAGFEFPWAALPLTLLLLLPLALFFSGLLLAVASFAANQKEAQLYCLPIYLLTVLGIMTVSMPGIELEGPLLLVPVLNTALLIKSLFLGHGTAQQVVFVFASTCMYAAGAVALAARIFAREEVLFSAQGSVRLFLSRRFFKPTEHPRAGDSLLLAALLFPLFFYFQLGLSKLLLDPGGEFNVRQFILLVGIPQYAAFLLVPLAVAWYLKTDLRKTFLWRPATFRAALGALLLGSSSWVVAHQLAAWQSVFWPFSPMDMEALEKPVKELSGTGGGLMMIIFLMAITPAICEESFFRGFVQRGLTSSKKWSSLIMVGIIFGAYHFPIVRQPVVMLMGISLAYVAYETGSLWPGVLYHFLHNTLSIFVPDLANWPASNLPPGQLPNVPLIWLLPAVGVFILGLILVRGSKVKTPATPVLIETPVLT